MESNNIHFLTFKVKIGNRRVAKVWHQKNYVSTRRLVECLKDIQRYDAGHTFNITVITGSLMRN